MANGDGLWAAITLAEKEGRLHHSVFAEQVGRPYRIHFIPDTHFPFQNDDVILHIVELCTSVDAVVHIGDLVDAYHVSSHDKNPLVRHTIEDEFKLAEQRLWKPIIKYNPLCRRVYVTGNHEERVAKYAAKKAPALYSSTPATIGRYINAERNKIEIVPRSGLVIKGVRAKHGDVARATGSARAEMIAHRFTGVSGHTHRCEHETIIDKEGHRTDWYSIGHACRPELMEYLNGLPNWQLSGGLTLTIFHEGYWEFVEHRLD